MADYYNAVPDGVIDDRFGVAHSDFKSPEYETLDKISSVKWEECRGLGRSFGFNRAEGKAETISSKDLIYLLVDIVSKNGNLLLDVGPEADGAIPPVQLSRLQALGSWLQQNGEAIYGTTPWTRPSGTTTDGTDIRFTRKDTVLYAILPDRPKSSSITIQSFSLNPAAKITVLGQAEPLSWSAQGSGTTVSLPPKLPGNYAFTLKIAGSGL